MAPCFSSRMEENFYSQKLNNNAIFIKQPNTTENMKQFLKQSTLLLSTAVIFFSACNKDETPTPDNSGTSTILTEVKSADSEMKIQYNANNQIQTVTVDNDPFVGEENVSFTVKYNSANLIEELTAANQTKVKAFYQQQNLTKTEVWASTLKISETIHTYEGNNLKTSEVFLFDNGEKYPYLKTEYTYNAAGNVTRTRAFMYNPLSNQLDYAGYINKTYDTKNNPFQSIKHLMQIFWEVPTTNNILKEEHFDDNNEELFVKNYVYTYNSKNYPTKAVITETEAGVPATTVTVNFSYK